MRTRCHILLGILFFATGGCAFMNGSQKGMVIGSSAGAAAGGKNPANTTAEGTIASAAVGGPVGAFIDDYMDAQSARMEKDLEGATVERIGEGIKITFDAGLMFDVDRAELRPIAKHNLTQLAEVLRKFDDTDVLIGGHTDSEGVESHNLALSERRARSVALVLAGGRVSGSRMTVIGYGESQPVADNATRRGKQANRRVEVAITANGELKRKAAEKEAD